MFPRSTIEAPQRALPKADSPGRKSLRLPAIFGAGLISSVFIVVLYLLNPLAAIPGMADDALFSVRYAHNFFAAGRLCWNLGEKPAFGATSQLFQWLTVGVQPLFGDANPASVIVLSLAGGVLAAIVLLWLLRREIDHEIQASSGRTVRISQSAGLRLLIGFGVALVALNPKFYQHWETGLETTWSIFLAALFVLLLPRLLASRRLLFLGLPIAALVLFWQRPDLGLIGTMPLMVGFFTGKGHRRTDYFFAGMVTAVLLAATLFVWNGYYGFPVPLPALVKTALSHYSGRNIDVFYAYANRHELFLYLRENFVALGYCVYFFAAWRRKTGRPLSISDISLGLGALAYALFEAFGNKYPITTGGARFFMPTLPILLYFAIRGFGLSLRGGIHEGHDLPDAKGSLAAYKIGLAALIALIVVQFPIGIKDVFQPDLHQALSIHEATIRDAVLGQMRVEGKWDSLIPVLANPAYDHCSAADSELGAIGLMPVTRTIYDLSGLNNMALTVDRESVRHYIERTGPDYIWYKRVDFYWGLNLEQNPQLRAHYDFDSSSGVATRRGSGCPAG